MINDPAFIRDLNDLIKKHNIDEVLDGTSFVIANSILYHLKMLETMKAQEELSKAFENGDFYTYVEPNWE
jgi:hypothetical protein